MERKSSLALMLERQIAEMQEANRLNVDAATAGILLFRHIQELTAAAVQLEELLENRSASDRTILSAHDSADGKHIEEFCLEPQSQEEALKLMMAGGSMLSHVASHLANGPHSCGHVGCMLRMTLHVALKELEAERPGTLKEYMQSLLREAQGGGFATVNDPSPSSLKH